ncbi:hypothetical protein UACE39S_01957 [Ureibacillus acetophenoni]
MKINKWFSTIIALLAIILSFTIGYLLGNHNATPDFVEMFYANVLSNENNTLHLEGIPENDINHRGEFIVAFNNIDSVYNIYSEKINIADLQKGSQIRVVYDGIVLESYPAQITHVIRIEQIE